jgi:hypothetical protein
MDLLWVISGKREEKLCSAMVSPGTARQGRCDLAEVSTEGLPKGAYNRGMERYRVVADVGLYDVLFTSFQISYGAIWPNISAGSEIHAKREKPILL